MMAWVLVALVVVVGVALGRVPEPAASVAANVTNVASGAEHHHDEGSGPCVVSSDCAGAWAFGAAGLLLAVAVAVPSAGLVPTVRRLVAVPAPFHSALLPSGLFRPPQPS